MKIFFSICLLFYIHLMFADSVYIRSYDLGGGGLRTTLFCYTNHLRSTELVDAIAVSDKEIIQILLQDPENISQVNLLSIHLYLWQSKEEISSL